MLFLVIILVDYLAYVLLKLINVTVPSAAVRNIDNIDFGGWGGALNSSFLVLIVTVLLLLFLSSSKVFRIVKVLWS